MISDIRKYIRYIKRFNPLYYIGRVLDSKKEIEIWRRLESGGLDFVEQREADIVGHSKYQLTRPNHMKLVRGLLSQCGITPKDAIVDIGCGKGGMLFFFHECGFGKTDGIEYSSELCRIAKSNMSKLNIEAKIVQADAAEYEQYDDYTYFYMYNPFGKDIMKRVVQNIENSRIRKPRTVKIIYSNPKYGDLFKHMGYKLVKAVKTSIFFPEIVAIYKKGDDI